MIKKKRITIYFKAFGHPHPFLNILKFEKIKRDVELWFYILQEIHLFFVVFSLF